MNGCSCLSSGGEPGCSIHGMFIARNKGEPMFKKYVAKPVVIEAFQYTGGNLDIEGFIPPKEGPQFSLGAHLQTKEGVMHLPIGNWVIRGTEGELYSCMDSVFQRKYSEVT